MDITDEDIVEIRETYRKTLEIPPLTNLPQFFLCTVGLVGAGKTTVVEPLAKKLSLVRISSDDVRKILKERKAGYDQLMKILGPLVEELAIRKHSLAFDADCGNPKTKEMIMLLAEKVGAKVFWIHVAPPEEFILNKLRNYKHTWLFKDGEQAVQNYFAQKKKREEENTPFDFLATIDTSQVSLGDQIEKVYELIKKELQ